jgi:hypothetical protein
LIPGILADVGLHRMAASCRHRRRLVEGGADAEHFHALAVLDRLDLADADAARALAEHPRRVVDRAGIARHHPLGRIPALPGAARRRDLRDHRVEIDLVALVHRHGRDAEIVEPRAAVRAVVLEADIGVLAVARVALERRPPSARHVQPVDEAGDQIAFDDHPQAVGAGGEGIEEADIGPGRAVIGDQEAARVEDQAGPVAGRFVALAISRAA